MKLSDRHNRRQNKIPPSQRKTLGSKPLVQQYPDVFDFWENASPRAKNEYMREIDEVVGCDRILDLIRSGRITMESMSVLTMMGFAQRCGYSTVMCGDDVIDILQPFPRADFIETWGDENN